MPASGGALFAEPLLGLPGDVRIPHLPLNALNRVLLVAWLASGGAMAAAQNANTVSTPSPPPRAGTVGPEQLRNFSLPGTTAPPTEDAVPPRRTPSAIGSAAAPAPPKAETVRRPQVRPAPPTPVPSDQPRTPIRTSVAASASSNGRAASAEAGGKGVVNLPRATPAPSAQPSFELDDPANVKSYPTGSAMPTDENRLPWWPWLLGATLLGIAGAVLSRRRSLEEADAHQEFAIAGGGTLPAADREPAPDRPEAAELAPASNFIRTRIPPLGDALVRSPPATRLAQAPPSSPGGIISTRLRASVEIELIAEAAALDDNEVVIQFELRITNAGSAPARNVVVEAVVLNAGDTQDAEILQFFERPDADGGAIDVLGPLDQTSLRSVVRMPRSAMREYVAQDRRLLVPILAFNAGYRFGTSSGRTSGAWLIGRATQGAERLGPLRLDQGPRRWTDLAQKRLNTTTLR